MPKQRITEEIVVNAAFEIARKSGMEQVMVKRIADNIGCSVQPIYSYCTNMEGLQQRVIERVCDFVKNYVAAHIDKENPFQSTGRAYLRMAKEEPQLFKLFITHQRNGISSLADLYETETNPQIAVAIAQEMKISVEQAKQLHLHMLIYTIGIGAIFASTSPGIQIEEMLAQQNAAYEVFLKQLLQNVRSDNEY